MASTSMDLLQGYKILILILLNEIGAKYCYILLKKKKYCKTWLA